jgi:predicted phage terminase large subunit-like protein
MSKPARTPLARLRAAAAAYSPGVKLVREIKAAVAVDGGDAPADEQAEAARIEALRAACLDSLEVFVRTMMPDWELPWFHVLLCRELQAWWLSAETYHLILELPPGHAKSWYAKLFVCWAFARDPGLRAAYTGYGQDLAEEHSGDIQGVMMEEAYTRLFPATRLNTRRAVSDDTRGAKRTKDEFHVVGTTGRFKAVGIGGPLTGFRSDLGIIDDPLKNAKDAASATVREDQWRWYTRVLKTRKRPKRTLKFLMLLTRWHLDDLAGRVQEREGRRWRSLRFPALKEGPPTADDPREDGEALWPDVATVAELEEIRESDPEGFASLYQARPVAEGGALFKDAWYVQRWVTLPAGPGLWIQSWDLRNDGKGKNTSWAVGGLFFRPQGSALTYLVDVVRGRWSPDESFMVIRRINCEPTAPLTTDLEREMEARRGLWSRASAKLIEKKADGVSALSLLYAEVPGLIPVKPTDDKVTRARGTTAIHQAGNLILPQSALWVVSWVGEHVTFPASAANDQVDMTSQALDYLYNVTGAGMKNLPSLPPRAGKAASRLNF